MEERAMDPAGARERALKLGAGLFVLGSILETGGMLHVDASLYDAVDRGGPVAKASVRGGAAELLEMVDRLTAELLASRCGGPNARLTQIAATSTRSLPALKAYLQGEHEMRGMRRGTAVEAFETAVRLDETFALAWYRLGVAALWSLQPEKAWAAAERAATHAGRLTERDRRLLDAFLAVLQGRNDDAERLYRGIVGLYPDEMDAWYHLGEMLTHHGPQRGRSLAESRGAWERLVELDPKHVSALVHLGAIAASLGEGDELHRLCRRVEALSPGSDSSLWMRALEAFADDDPAGRADVVARARRASDHTVTWVVRFVGAYLGDLDGARIVAETLTEAFRSAPARALGHNYIAHLEMARGRPAAALARLAEAARGDAAAGLLYRARMAAHPVLVAARPILEEALRDLEAWSCDEAPAADERPLWMEPHRGLHAPLRLYLMGLLAARLGRAPEAARRAAALASCRAPAGTGALVSEMALSVEAAAAEARGDRGEALDLLRRIKGETCFYMSLWSPFFSQAQERFRLAELLAAEGREEEAIPWYRSFGHQSLFDMVHTGPSLLRLAGIHRRLGESHAAAAHCTRLLRLWEGSEPSFGEQVAAARRMLQELSGPGA
jgi:tetratricopeptide (TPR) repeat protein